MTGAPLRLVADVGGTHARFAHVDGRGRPEPVVSLPSARFDALGPAVRAALAELGRSPDELSGASMAVAVAGPVTGDRVELTNASWGFSLEETRKDLGLGRLVALNDFEALALSLPHLTEEDVEVWRTGIPAQDAPRALLGPGTGLGVGALVAAADGWSAVSSEGGHRDLAPTSEREWLVTRPLADGGGRLSAEDVLSGPGLSALDAALRRLDGSGDLPPRTPEEIGERARAGDDGHAAEAVALFSGFLGAVAGDLALTFGARGGVALSGGVLAGLGAAFDRRRFFDRFDSKGRMSRHVETIPVARIVSDAAALLGAASRLAASSG